MRKRIILTIFALGLISLGVVSSITSCSANNGQVSSNDATATAYSATAVAGVDTTLANIDATATAANAATANAATATATANVTVTVDLPTAVKQQLVTASFTSTGSASGDAIEITLHRFTSQNSDIKVTLPPGLLLTNSDPTEQNMILLQIAGMENNLGAGTYTPATVMELAPGETDAYYVVKAYCVNLHKGNPGSGNGMTLSGQASSDLVSLIKAELSSNDSDSVIQAAVWAITDNPTRDDLNQYGPFYQLSDQDIQSVRDLLRAAGLNPANYRLTA